MALPAIALGAAAAGVVYLGYKTLTAKAPVRQILETGRTYTIRVVLDWTKLPGATPTVPDRDAYSRYLGAIFGGLEDPRSVVLPAGASLLSTPDGLGFKVVEKASLATQADAENFFAGKPSVWVLTGVWLRSPISLFVIPKQVLDILPKAEFTPRAAVVAPTLEKGRTYALLVTLDWRQMPGAATKKVPLGAADRDNFAKYLKITFGGLEGQAPSSVTLPVGAQILSTPDGLGFKVMSQPFLHTQGDAEDFFVGKPSSWVLTGQWLRDAKSIDMPPELKQILPSTSFSLLTVA